MKRISLILFMFASLFVMFGTSYAAETKVEGKIYAAWWIYLNDTLVTSDGNVFNQKGNNQFTLERSYMTMNSKISDHTSVNLTADLRSTEGYSGYDLILKFGFATITMPFYEPLSAMVGLQRIRHVDFVESYIWQRRYLEKVIGDRVGFVSSADLGVTISHALGEKGKLGAFGLGAFNGGGYSNVTDANKYKDLLLFASYKPFSGIPALQNSAVGGQAYLGTRNIAIDTSMDAGDYSRRILSAAARVNYRDIFDLGTDFWLNKLGQGPAPAEDLSQSALMLYGAVYLKNLVSDNSALRTLDFFFRYDIYDPNTDGGAGRNKQNYMIFGLECQPAKGVNAALNYRSTSFESDALDSQNFVFLNTEFKF